MADKLPADEPVTTVDGLVAKYGTRTIRLTVERLVHLAPSFSGDVPLARELAVMMADLECALEDHARRKP
jgi:hypothetical protein